MVKRAFQTARFKVHHPSRHKQAMLLEALESYHSMAKRVLENALSEPELLTRCSLVNRKGLSVPNGYAAAKYIRTLTPKRWNLAPVRDYLIGDVVAALMSHFAKQHKGKNDSNPPALPRLGPISDEEYVAAHDEIVLNPEFPVKADHQQLIDMARLEGHSFVAKRLERVFRSRAATKAVSQLLRKIDGPIPRPIEFRHCELAWGFLLAKRDGNLYCLMRLFSSKSRFYDKKLLADGFIDLKTGVDLSGREFPGVILPLEMGREFHENEYLKFGSPQSAKLLLRRDDAGNPTFYVHVAFEFTPVPIEPETLLGLDRGAVKIGSGCVIGFDGTCLESGLTLEGAAFSAEMAAHRKRIADMQRRGIQRSRIFKLRGRRSDAIVGKYANALIAMAVEHRSHIVLEKIDGPMMGRFLTQSQFAKLKRMLVYKACRVGLPEPIEVPAARTSQTCAICGFWSPDNRPKRDAEGKPQQDIFLCCECGYRANADENASVIIALRGLHQVINHGRFQKWKGFELWLKTILGRDGQATVQ